MQDPAKAAQGGGLAGAVLPQHDQHLAALDVQVNPIDCAYVAETLTKVLDQDHWSAELTLSRLVSR
jgi:hypothetical protein